MLEIVYSPDWHALSAYARAQIVAAAQAGRGGNVLIVPEQFSFETERSLCAEGGAQISRYAEVLSFSRLAERSLATCGGIARPLLDRGGRIMALSRAVEQVRSRLKTYAASARRADFLLQMSQIVDELKCYCVDSAALHQAATALDGALAVKTEELALLLESYESVCANGLQDPRDRLRLLCDHIRLHGFGRELRIYTDGFLGFTALEIEILQAFLAQGVDVSVCLCCDAPFAGAEVFASVHQAARSLSFAADRCGARVVTTAVPAGPGLHEVARSAFSRERALDASGLRLYTCDSPGAEAEAICADILAHVRAGGRYRDLAVACADPASLRPILEAEFARCGIPAFFAEKRPALRTPLAGALMSALRAASGRMERDDVLAWLKSDCAPLTPAETDRLENYALLWNITGESWLREWRFHPRGLGQKWSEDDRAAARALDALRVRAIGPLRALRHGLQTHGRVGEYVLDTYEFLKTTDFSGSLSRRIDQLEREGQQQSLQVMRQLYELLLHALEQLYSVQYDSECSAEQFVRRMEILLAQYPIGAIPAVLDAVTVGEPTALQHRASVHLFVCGCADRHFPAASAGGSLLNEADRSRLSQVGIQFAPNESEQMDRNLTDAYALLAAPTRKLTLSVGGAPSAYLFTTLCALYPEAVHTHSDAPPSYFATAQTLGLWLAGQEMLPEAAPPAARDYCRALRTAAGYDFGCLHPAQVEALYGRVLSLSASCIDRYASCRFSFFLRDGLRATERRAAAFDAPIYGTFVHDVLQHTLEEVARRGGIAQVDDGQLQQIARDRMERYLREEIDPVLLESPRAAYLLRRNFAEISEVVQVLGSELRASRFVPTDFELGFGEHQALPPVAITTPTHRAALRGAVDRVDLYETGGQTFFRVIDYKTGEKKLDFTDLLERRGLQMLLYLFSIEQNGAQRYGTAPHPAGILYVPAHDAIPRLKQRPGSADEASRSHAKERERKGLLLHDIPLLEAMGSPELMPYKRTGDEVKSGVMNLEQLGLLRRYVNRSVADITDEIYSGALAPNPYVRGQKGSCTYCPYASVCHRDLCGTQPRALQATTEPDFWAELTRKEAEHGRI